MINLKRKCQWKNLQWHNAKIKKIMFEGGKRSKRQTYFSLSSNLLSRFVCYDYMFLCRHQLCWIIRVSGSLAQVEEH